MTQKKLKDPKDIREDDIGVLQPGRTLSRRCRVVSPGPANPDHVFVEMFDWPGRPRLVVPRAWVDIEDHGPVGPA